MQHLLPFEKIKREIFVKRKAETSSDYGQYPDKRDIKEKSHQRNYSGFKKRLPPLLRPVGFCPVDPLI